MGVRGSRMGVEWEYAGLEWEYDGSRMGIDEVRSLAFPPLILSNDRLLIL
jgi:hypothetical protein